MEVENRIKIKTSAAVRGKIVTNLGWTTKTKRLSMHENLAMEFHECKLMY
jgi:hypothetical protein